MDIKTVDDLTREIENYLNNTTYLDNDVLDTYQAYISYFISRSRLKINNYCETILKVNKMYNGDSITKTNDEVKL